VQRHVAAFDCHTVFRTEGAQGLFEAVVLKRDDRATGSAEEVMVMVRIRSDTLPAGASFAKVEPLDKPDVR